MHATGRLHVYSVWFRVPEYSSMQVVNTLCGRSRAGRTRLPPVTDRTDRETDHAYPGNRRYKYVGRHGNRFAMFDFIFDFNTHYGSISHRLAGNKLLPVYTSGLRQPEVVLRRQQRSVEWLRGHERCNTKPPQAKNGLQRALAAKPEVEIWRKYVQSMSRPRFPIRPPIH